MSPALETWFTNYQNQWVHHYRHDLQTTKINESRPPDVIHRWPKSMSPGTRDMFYKMTKINEYTTTDMIYKLPKSMSPALTDIIYILTKINKSTSPDVIHRRPKSMSPALQMWFTDDQNQWVHGLQDMIHRLTKIKDSRHPDDMIYRKKMTKINESSTSGLALQIWFTYWPEIKESSITEMIYKLTKINESSTPESWFTNWLKSMSPALLTWFTKYQNQWVHHYRHYLPDWPKSMSPALQMWFTDDQNQWVQPSRCDSQMTKINESRPPNMFYKLPKSMTPAL